MLLKALYRGLCILATPFFFLLAWYFGRRNPDVFLQRRGMATVARPVGSLVWIHGASRGELMALKALCQKIKELNPSLSFLITTSSPASGDFVAKLFPGAIHQYLPLDHPFYIQSFLDHWQPNLVLWLECDFWPITLWAMEQRHIKVLLLNARVSKTPFFASILPCFQKIFVNHPSELAFFPQDRSSFQGNLKYTVAPLAYDPEQLAAWQEALVGRPMFLAASTHKGEEAMVLSAHQRLKEEFPNLLTVVVPRHPARALDVLHQMEAGSSPFLYSAGMLPAEDQDMLVVDAFGVLGLFYALAPFAFLGGSLVKVGGHTLIEPALLKCAVATGPYVFNNQGIYDDFKAKDAVLWVSSPADLASQMRTLLLEPWTVQTLQERAYRVVAEQLGAETLSSQIIVEIQGVLTP